MPIDNEPRDATLRHLLEELDYRRAQVERLDAEVDELGIAVARLEEARRYQLDRYDLAPIAYLTLDRQGAITNANRRACALLVFGHQQLLGVPLLALLTTAYRRRFLEHVLASRRSPDPTAFEVTVMTGERAVVAVRLSIRWTAESGGCYAVCLIDLRERDAAIADYQRLVDAERRARAECRAKDRLIALLSRPARAPLSAGRQSAALRTAAGRARAVRRSERRHRVLR